MWNFECALFPRKGARKETRGVQRPIFGQAPGSEGRMPPLNHFETKRKKAPNGAPSRIRDLNLAERMGLGTNSLREKLGDPRKHSESRALICIDNIHTFVNLIP
jgi:hypothetical protein